MAMRPCAKCLENNWRYDYQDGVIVATCRNCENEVSFAARQKHRAAGARAGVFQRMAEEPVKLHNPNIVIDPNFVDDGVPPWD